MDDMMDNGLDEEMDESFEDFDDDFDPDMDPDVEGDLDLDVDDSAEDYKDKDNYVESTVATAVRANPKRAQARKKAARVIEGILGSPELAKPEGQLKMWERLYEQADVSLAKPYAIKGAFAENDVVEHSKFGIGFVLEESSTTKIAVLFKEGIKKLVCQNPPSTTSHHHHG